MGNAVEIQISAEPTGSEAPFDTGRPDHIPEKFWDAETKSIKTEALLNSYTELEKKIGAPKETPQAQEQGAEGGQEEEQQSQEEDADKTAQEAAEAAGVDMAALQAEVDKDGKLSDESYAKLEKAGFPKAEVDEYIAFKQAKADDYVKAVKGAAGSDDAFDKMVEWAAKGYTAEQAKVFNDAVNSGNKSAAEAAVKALKSDYEKVNGKVPKLVQPTGGASPTAGRYESLDQMLKDQADPRYGTDPAFRAKVIEKLKNSNI